ncbi:RNA polymerase sigma factor [Haloflavibacter putidus]|uniref:RNA polymerase sigma factor n=1 Tax=Haloflavibacter putidus TaxID=2576776 RepID=A0A507ZZX7_9FLAO|nr:RNA polymerase sigma factor [Haloflavibacter putidus]TQD39132.1 RNA polymerase sigma factor [Haloflavibacter putidus]
MNQKAFLEYINPLKDKIYRLSLRYLVSKEAAQDATQEVLLKLWKLKDKLSGYNNPEAFAMTITKNYCLDQLKLKTNNNLRIVHNNFDDGNPSLQKQLEAKNELEIVGKIIEGLSENEKLLIHLRDIEQLDYQEIAEITKMKNTAIRVALSRARKKIREEILKKHSYGAS